MGNLLKLINWWVSISDSDCFIVGGRAKIPEKKIETMVEELGIGKNRKGEYPFGEFWLWIEIERETNVSFQLESLGEWN